MYNYIIKSGNGYLLNISEYGAKMTSDKTEARCFDEELDAILVSAYMDELGYETQIVKEWGV